MANPRRWPIGLQSGPSGRPTGIGDVIKELTRSNIAFFSASTDGFSILTDLQNARAANPEVPHTANWTVTGYWPREEGAPNRYHLNVPEYTKPHSEEVARRHWDMIEKREPINDPNRSPIRWDVPCIWISSWNEIRDYVGWFKKEDEEPEPSDVLDGYEGNADLVGWHAYEVGKEAVRRGYRWAAFGFSGGSPEKGFWDAPGILAYLRLCEQHPDQLGVALHEYALADTILNRPDHIGHFKQLHDACDRHGIRRPVIQIKEFGWRDIKIPDDPKVAMRELIDVANMYMEHPNIHGAAIWTVQPWPGSINLHKVADLIPLLRDAALQHARELKPLATPSKPPVTPAVSPTSTDADSEGATGIVNAEAGLNLRTEPSTDGGKKTIIKKLKFRDEVAILGFDKGWYRAKAGRDTGYVSAVFITLNPSSVMEEGVEGLGELLETLESQQLVVTPVTPSKTGFVTATAKLNLRSEPSTGGNKDTVLELLDFGERVEIIGKLDRWYQVRARGQVGFVSADWVALGDTPPLDQPKIGTGPAKGGFQPGMNINTGVHSMDIDRMRGLSWVRFVFIAADKNRSIDDAFNQTYESLIREYAAAGIKSLVILNHETEHGNKPWANKENKDWAGYVEPFSRAAQRVAELCAQFGDNVAFQIWNEQDSGWGSDAGNKNPSAHGMPPRDYGELLVSASRAIRAAAPRATIVAGGLKTGPHNGAEYLLEAQRAKGGSLEVDAIACHPYGRFVRTDSFYGQRFGKLSDALAVYRRAFPQHPLWITEVGIVGGDKPLGSEHNENIANYISEFVDEVANRQADHVPVLIWFSWTDRMVNAGILTDDGREKESIYQAFQGMKARGVMANKASGKGVIMEESLESLAEFATRTKAYVTAQPWLNLRSEPGTHASILAPLVTGTELEILELGTNGWHRVRAGGQEGYVSAEWVTFTPPTSTSPVGAKHKPPHRTRSVIGIHGAPGAAAPPKHTWDDWTRRLNEMGIQWYKQCDSSDGTGDGSIFQWVLHLKRNGIEPIVRYMAFPQFPNNLEDKHFRQMQRYAQEGVHWAEIGNEPNLGYEWVSDWWTSGNDDPPMAWPKGKSIERLAQLWIEDATRAADMGAWPAFYAFGPTDWGRGRPNGKYSSTVFTEQVVARLASHHRAATVDLFKNRKAWIAVHVAKYERPLDYDPYSENPNKPWDMCLRGYQVVQRAFRQHFAGVLNVDGIPIISTEGGVFTPEHRNKLPEPGRVPANDEEHARQTVEMYRYVANNTSLTAMCPWCISESDDIGIRHQEGGEFRDHGWFKQVGGSLVDRPIYHAMRRLRDEGSGKGVSLESLAAEGLESLGETAPETAEKEATITVTLNLQIKIEGGGVKDVVVNVNPEVAD